MKLEKEILIAVQVPDDCCKHTICVDLFNTAKDRSQEANFRIIDQPDHTAEGEDDEIDDLFDRSDWPPEKMSRQKFDANTELGLQLCKEFDALTEENAQLRAELSALKQSTQTVEIPHGLSDEQIAGILKRCGKPEEIAGDADIQRERVAELLRWFEREGNPKWFKEHAFELVYYLATLKQAAPITHSEPVKWAGYPAIGYVHLVPDNFSDEYQVKFWKPIPIGTKLYTHPAALDQLERLAIEQIAIRDKEIEQLKQQAALAEPIAWMLKDSWFTRTTFHVDKEFVDRESKIKTDDGVLRYEITPLIAQSPQPIPATLQECKCDTYHDAEVGCPGCGHIGHHHPKCVQAPLQGDES